MDSWYDKVGSFDDPAVILVLMYLSMGIDYPYNMAKNFKVILENLEKFEEKEYQKEIYVNEENENLEVRYCLSTPNIKISSPLKKISGLKLLKYPGKLASLLRDLKEYQLINSVPDYKIKRRQRNFYEINPEIFRSETSLAGNAKENVKKLHKDISENTIEYQIVSFLSWFGKQKSGKNERIEELNIWCTSPLLDFITFLEFINIWISKWEVAQEEEMKDKQKLSEHMNTYIRHLLKKHDKKVYVDTFRRPFFPVGKTMKSNENPWLQADR